jgi:hypothetical protein
VSCYNHDGTAYVNSFNNPGVTADLSSNAIPDSVLTKNLVAWYRFEDGDARDYTATLNATFADSTAYDGTVTGATHNTTGGVTDFKNGSSSGVFEFTGSGEIIDNTSISNVTGGASKSLTYWVNHDNLSTGAHQVNLGDRVVDGEVFGTYNQSGDLSFLAYGAGFDYDTGINLSADGNWDHIAVTYDGSTVNTYFNGSLTPTTGKSRSLNTQAGIQIGGGPEFSSLDGSIDDVRVYSKELSGTEVNDIYNESEP